jgi:cytochrome c peroxidase
MKKKISLLLIVSMAILIYSCRKNSNIPSGTVYLDLPATPYEYNPRNGNSGFIIYDTTINYKATVGRVLFYDTHLSLNNAVSCGSCHKQALGFADNVPLSAGYQGMLTKRNSKSLSNIAGDSLSFTSIGQANLPLFWDGRVDTLESLISHPVTNHVEMGVSDFSVLPSKLSGLNYYNQLFIQAYGDANISSSRIAECISMFLVSIQSHTTRFDQLQTYLIFGPGSIGFLGSLALNNPIYTVQETQGCNLFFSTYNCAGCHHLTDDAYGASQADFNDIGLDKNYVDMGLGTISGSSSDNGKFMTPSLRNVALSAPYMHDGRYQTLSQVIDHYSHNIQASQNLAFELRDSTGINPKQMNIPDADKQALIAFLNTLTDYQMVSDPKFSNPFKVK